MYEIQFYNCSHFEEMLFMYSIVRMKYRFSDVYSDKNSLAIIYMCLKMHCLKYVINFILFYSCGPGVAI